MTTQAQARKQLLYPLALGLVGALGVFAMGGWGWSAAGLAVVLAAAGLLVGRHLSATHTALLAALDNYLVGQQHFSEQVVPVWTGHLATSQEQM